MIKGLNSYFNWPDLLTALLIVVIGAWAAKLVAAVIEKAVGRSKMNKTLGLFVKNIIYYVVLIFVILAALEKVGIKTTSFIALVGAAGLAIGLALQGSLPTSPPASCSSSSSRSWSATGSKRPEQQG